MRAGKIDVIVVYKVDRLTRSLADFAKLVELFDQHNVSFVSVTQQFNTTTSMGRLTLNVLLSFAQFEREVTSERIRDKIAASKRKGLWVGGMVPLGYDTKDRRSSSMRRGRPGPNHLPPLSRARQPQPADGRAAQAGIVTKVRTLKSGERSAAFRSPAVRSPIFCATASTSARSSSRARSCKGEQPAILDRRPVRRRPGQARPSRTNNHKATDEFRGTVDRSHLRRSRQSHDPEPRP